MLAFTNGGRTIEVVVPKMDAAFAPIFQIHSIAVMNVVSADCIFCAYPQLTFDYLWMVNLGLICDDAFGVVYVDALRKYQVRGFTYLPWSTQVGKTPETPYCSRNLADALSVFIDTANVSSMKGQVWRDGH